MIDTETRQFGEGQFVERIAWAPWGPAEAGTLESWEAGRQDGIALSSCGLASWIPGFPAFFTSCSLCSSWFNIVLSPLWQLFEVGQILVSSCRCLVHLEIFQADQADIDTVQLIVDPLGVGIIEVHSGN